MAHKLPLIVIKLENIYIAFSALSRYIVVIRFVISLVPFVPKKILGAYYISELIPYLLIM